MLRRVLMGAALAIVLGAASFAASAWTETVTFVSSWTWTGLGGSWASVSCPEALRAAAEEQHERRAICGQVEIPERPGSVRTVQLAVVRLPPKQKSQDAPLLLLPGGPGDSFTPQLEHRLQYLGRLSKDRELIIVDQRGAGGSRPLLKCSNELKTAFDLRLCFNSWQEKTDLSSYTTAQSAFDLKRVLKTLGIEKVAIYSVSYGTRLALEFAERWPELVESLVLDSPIPRSVDLLAEAGPNALSSLDSILAACQQDSDCVRKFPSTRGELTRVVVALNQEEEGRGTQFLKGISQLSVTPEVLRYIPVMLYRAKTGRTGEYRNLLKGFSEYEFSLGLHLSVQCAEVFRQSSQKAILEAGERRMPPELAEGLLSATYEQQCWAWAVPASADPKKIEAKVPVPALVLNGQYDPATPPHYGAIVADALPQSLHVVLEGRSHGAGLSNCGSATIRWFLRKEGKVDGRKPPPCVQRPNPLKPSMKAPSSSRQRKILKSIRYRL